MPELSTALQDAPFSVFEEVNAALSGYPGAQVAPLHQGKTWFTPRAGSIAASQAHLGLALHQHPPPGGVALLRERLAEHVCSRYGLVVEAEQVIVTVGATHAISLVLNSILEPGDEVILAAPQWLFATGLVEAARGVPVEVPLFSALAKTPDRDIIGLLDRATTSRTRALYFNSPNNPTGTSLSPAQLSQVAEWAAARGTWLIADNAYENFDFTYHGFTDIGRLAPDLAFSVYTFSKTYAMPGYRVGYVVCPPGTASRLRKWALYSVYSVATASQVAALNALGTPVGELDRRRLLARQARDVTAATLVMPYSPIDGSLYAWLDVRGWAKGAPGVFAKACSQAGVGLAPGEAFGTGCEGWVRLCFTAVPPEELLPALEVVNQVYEEGRAP
ncbi:MAG TPA: pyridoxal phosphate-dependent aminotransferase [Acidimicrobiales bacterium]|nr:pyridoxal phosphate-dependent aminotransferase [Acidimicrobiales bacterium]